MAGEGIQFSLRHANGLWRAQAEGEESFLVGREYRNGLNLDGRDNYGPRYEPADALGVLGIWAYVLYPTTICESGGYYFCNNTYDAAWFTFGFYQFVVTDEDGGYPRWGDFVRFLRALLTFPEADRYFPDLTLYGGRIAQVTAGGVQPLETAESTAALTRYFNPSRDRVEEREVDNLARMIHWSGHHPEVLQLQRHNAALTARSKIDRYLAAHPFTREYPDYVCLAMIDLMHHEGAESHFRRIHAALEASGSDYDEAFDRITALDSDQENRIPTLRREVRRLRDAGLLGQKTITDLQREGPQPPQT